jgi:hypothetical protein
MAKETNQSKSIDDKYAGKLAEIRTLSAPVVNRVHLRMETGMKQAHLDKASLVRLAVRLFIRNYYRGAGEWDFSTIDGLDMIIAADAARCDYELAD